MGDKRLCDVCIKRSRFFVEHVVRAADFIHSFIHSFHYHSANFVLDRDMQKMTIVIHIYIDIYKTSKRIWTNMWRRNQGELQLTKIKQIMTDEIGHLVSWCSLSK